MKVYTKTGDQGTTSLIGGERVFKSDERVEAYGSVTKFTIPGGNAVVSMCHVCRTVCRRAERASLRAAQKYGADSTALVYLNRLSDYFYLLGRVLTEHFGVEEQLWIP